MTLYSRAGFTFDDKAAWVARMQATLDTGLAGIKGKLTKQAYYAAKSLGDALVVAVAGVMAANDVNIATAVDYIFPQWSPLLVLKLWGSLLSLPAYPASFAGPPNGVAPVKVNGAQNTVIDIYSVLTGPSGLQYKTTEAATLTEVDTGDGSYFAVVPVVCLSVGAAGNAAAGTDFTFLPSIDGVTGAVANLDFTGGADAEQTEHYRARIVARIQNPPVAGSSSDLSTWAESLASVARAWTVDEYPMPGWATTYYTRAGGNPVPSGSGSAFCVPLTAVGVDSSVSFIMVHTSDVDSAIGAAINQSYWVGGRVIMGNGTASPGSQFNIVGITKPSVDWGDGLGLRYVISISGTPTDTLGNKTFGQVHLLDAQGALVYDAIRLDVTGNVRTPSGMKNAVVQPAIISEFPLFCIQATVFPQTDSIRNATIAAWKSLLQNAAPGSTISNWTIHEAIAGIPNHTSHVLGWVGIINPPADPVGSATSDVTMPTNSINAQFAYSVNESPLTIHADPLWS